MSPTYAASAPGKLVLFGEYAVLEGAPSLVMATGTRARATYEVAAPSAPALWHVHAPNLRQRATLQGGPLGGAAPLQPLAGVQFPSQLSLVVALLQAVHTSALGALPPGTLTCDTSAFYSGNTKLGLGSSGAITVAAWHALAAAAKLTSAGPQTTLIQLRAVHSAHQGGSGSGVDLAASLMGGLVRYQLGQAESVHPEVVGPLSATRMTPLPGLYVLPLWTGRAAATGPYLQAFKALKAQDPQLFWRICEEMALISRAACELWALGEVTPLLPLVPRSVAALERLGGALQLDLVTNMHREAAAAAQAAGACYKPSGAGGGDFGLLFAPSVRLLNKASRALVSLGLTPMPQENLGKPLAVHQSG